MTRYDLRIARAAAQSIASQAESYSSPQLGERWQTAVSEAIQSLQYSPERGTLCGYGSPQLAGLPRIPIRGFPFHLIFYQVFTAMQTVRIVDVIDGGCALEALLGANDPI